MTLLEIFERLEQTAIGDAIRNSLWLFPAIEAGHLLALALLGGTVLLVDLRLVGVGLRRQSPARLGRSVRPYLLGSVAALFATGVPLFLAEAIKCYYSPAFWVKMGALAAALAFTFTVRRVALRHGGRGHGVLAAAPAQFAVGLTSMATWFTVAAAGRWIGFS